MYQYDIALKELFQSFEIGLTERLAGVAPVEWLNVELSETRAQRVDFVCRLADGAILASTDCSFVSGEVFGLGLEFTSGSQSLNNGNVMAQVIRMRPNDASTNQIRLRQTYTYDNVNRIASAVEIAEVGSTGSGWSMNWAYDHRGNMWVSSHNTPLTVGTPEKLTWYDQTRNQLSYISDTQNAGTTNFYDLSGNLTSRPKEVGAGVDTFTYDGENRINTVNGAATYYQYDSVGKRVVTQTASPSQTVTFIYNAFGQLVREYGSSVQNSGYSYLTQDNLGSTRVITSPTGNVLARMDYEPFGRELTSGSATARRTPLPDGTFTSITGFGGLSAFKQRFTGKERDDETGLDYFGFRYFSSAQGRWTSPDQPFADQHPEDPQSWNMYGYVRNNPLAHVDPNGKACSALNNSSGFCQRADLYGNLDALVGSKTRFFAAASAASQELADVAVPGFGAMAASSGTRSFLESTGQALEKLNLEAAGQILSGQMTGSPGALDRAMVHREQTEVQKQLDQFKGANAEGYGTALKEINSLLNGTGAKTQGLVLGGNLFFGTDKAYSQFLGGVRKSLGHDIDFSNQKDREAIGNSLVNHIRNGGCDVTGDKVKCN